MTSKCRRHVDFKCILQDGHDGQCQEKCFHNVEAKFFLDAEMCLWVQCGQCGRGRPFSAAAAGNRFGV